MKTDTAAASAEIERLLADRLRLEAAVARAADALQLAAIKFRALEQLEAEAATLLDAGAARAALDPEPPRAADLVNRDLVDELLVVVRVLAPLSHEERGLLVGFLARHLRAFRTVSP